MSQNDQETSDEKSIRVDDLVNSDTSDITLRNKIVLLEKQLEANKDQVARAQAELENNRRRMEQEVAKARKFGAERLIAELIPVVDSLVHGLNIDGSDDPHVQSMRQGMELTLDLFHKMLEKNGVALIDPQVGELFNPMLHEAMSARADPTVESNTVLEVLQKGYSLHGRVIRAAMVIVAQ